MKAAIIGCGMMGKVHADCYISKGIEIAAVCDSSYEKLSDFALNYNTRTYTSVYEMMKKESVDLISICTPVNNHYSSMKAAIENNYPILCEKPFCANLTQADTIADLIIRKNIPFQLGFKMRYENVYSKAKEIIDSGEIGELQYIFISHYQPFSIPEWYMDNGVIQELLIHAFDIVNWFFCGEMPNRIVVDRCFINHRKGEDKAFINLYYSGNRRAYITGGYMPFFPNVHGGHDFVFQFIGEKGYVAAKRNSNVEVFSHNRIETISLSPVNAFSLEIDDFLKLVKGKKSDKLADIQDAVNSQRLYQMVVNAYSEYSRI